MAAEFHINDSLSYMRFLGLEVGGKVPDGNTIWDFKEVLKEHEVDRVKCDAGSKIITDFSVTDASVHDSQEFVSLVSEKDNNVKADSGYIV